MNLFETTDTIDVNTIYGYNNNIKTHVIPYFGADKKMCKITDVEIKGFINHLFNKTKQDGTDNLSVATVEKIYTAFSWIIRYCSEIAKPKLIKRNYLNDITFKHLIPKGRTRAVRKSKSHTLNELLDLIGTLDREANIRLKTMVSIIIDSGCRTEECCGIKIKHIDMKTGIFEYEEAVTGKVSNNFDPQYSGTRVKVLKSPHSYRKNVLTQYTLDCINNLITFKKALGIPMDEDSYLFTVWDSDQLLSPITFADEYKKFRNSHGFSDFPLHQIRHTLSNLLQEKGYSAKDVARYLGNTPRTLLESYTEIRDETNIQIKDTISSITRLNQSKCFKIETIAEILNSNEIRKNSDVYSLLDFTINGITNSENEYWVLENAKRMILDQHPDLKILCDDNKDTLKGKIETYKMFDYNEVELIQDKQYFVKPFHI